MWETSFDSRVLNSDTNSSSLKKGQVESCSEAWSSVAGWGESWRKLYGSRGD